MPSPKKSKAEAVRSGTYRADRHHDPLSLVPGVVAKPPGMSKDAESLWDAYVPVMADAGVLEIVDGFGLAQVFEAYVLACRARDLVGDSPVYEAITYGPDGGEDITLKKHPGMTAWKDAVATLRGLLADYGMTPLARMRMAAALTTPGDGVPERDVPGAPVPVKPKAKRGKA